MEEPKELLANEIQEEHAVAVDPEPEEVKAEIADEDTVSDSESEMVQKSGEEMLTLAKKRGMKRRPSHKTADGEMTEYDVVTFKTKSFQQFGVGIYLYFKFLKQLSKLFLFLFVLSVPLSLSCISSHGKLEKTPLMFEQTTIGNLGSSEMFQRIHYPSFVSLSGLKGFGFIDYDENTNSIDKADAGMIFAWSDLVGTLVFLVFLIYVKVSQKREAQATDDANITVSDYTILVEGLPRDCYNREELQHHFQTKNTFGKVVDVAICYNDTGIIRKYLQKATALEKVQSALVREEKPKKIASLEKKVAKSQKKLAKITKKYDKHCICAYVTFNMATSVRSVMYHYPRTFLARLFMKKTLKFRNKYKIRVSRAAEPSEIIYDNMKYSKCNVRLRRIFTVVLSFVVIAMSCGMSLVAATYRANNLKSMNDEETCPLFADPEQHFLSEMDSSDLPEDHDPDWEYDVDCICSQLDYKGMMDHHEECRDYLTETAIANVLIGGSAVIIVVINLALKFIARLLANFEKHTSLTQMERELTWKMFVGLFFNTALIILLVNAKVDSFNLFFLFQGEYEDFHPEWYQIVGVSLLLTMILNVVNPHVLPVAMHPFQKCALWCKERKIIKSRRNTHTQRELNALYDGKPFTLAERYAIICNTIYVSFFYSSGMPVLLLIASCTFFVTYYCDKFVLLKKSKTPPQYNEHIAQFAVSLIKPIIYIHLAVSIWVYGSDSVLMNHPLNSEYGDEYGYGSDLEEKFLNYSCFPSFLALLFLLGFEFVSNVLKTLRLTQCAASVLKRCALCFCPCICRRCIKTDTAVHVQENIGSFLDELAGGLRFESYLPSFQDMYDMAYVHEDMRKETKGLLIKEEPLYVKQNMMAAMKGAIL